MNGNDDGLLVIVGLCMSYAKITQTKLYDRYDDGHDMNNLKHEWWFVDSSYTGTRKCDFMKALTFMFGYWYLAKEEFETEP